MEETTLDRMVNYSPRNGEAIAAVVWRSERCKGGVGSAEEDYKSKVKLNVCDLRDEMSAVKLRDGENVQKYASKIQGYVNDFNLCAESSTGTMPKM